MELTSLFNGQPDKSNGEFSIAFKKGQSLAKFFIFGSELKMKGYNFSERFYSFESEISI